MCLYPRLIYNRKYTKTKKNGGIVPRIKDKRTQAVAVGCGNCEECRKMKAREWQIRMQEEIKTNTNGKFVTLTFSEESLKELVNKVGVDESNAVATYAVRHFLERWRKIKKKSIRHWLVTELGHENTERIHLHGILFTDESEEFIKERWMYGNIWVGEYVNAKTVNYIVKYITKIDEDHKTYKSIILSSAGIGSNYVNTWDFKQNEFRGEETKETYRLNNGAKVALPIYYRNKRYSEEERELLWLQKLDKEERYILGNRYKTDTVDEQIKFIDALMYAQKENIKKGFGSSTQEWKKESYNTSMKMLKDRAKDR